MLNNYFHRYPIWFLLILFLINRNTLAQPDDIKFDRLTSDDGLPSSLVNDVYKDSRGFIWFGTLAGLARYDGSDFKVYNSSKDKPGALSNDQINCIIEDIDGNLWCGTSDGLNKLDFSSDKFIVYRNDPNDSTSISHNMITFMINDPEENLWIGTRNGGLNLYDRKLNRFTSYLNKSGDTNSLGGNLTWAGCFDREGNLWVGTNCAKACIGLNKFDKSKNKFFHFELPFPKYPDIGLVTSVFEDDNQNIWVGTTEGLNKMIPINNKEKQDQRYEIKRYFFDPPRFINHVIESESLLWISCSDGLIIMNPKTDKYRIYKNEPGNQHSLVSSDQDGIYLDKDGIFWLMSDNGVSYYNKNKWNFKQYFNERITAISEGNYDNLFIGTTHGLYSLNRTMKTEEKIIYYKPVPESWQHNVIFSISPIVNNKMLVSMGPFLYKCEIRKGIIANFSNIPVEWAVMAICIDHDGLIWLGLADFGIRVLNKDMNEIASIQNISGDSSSLTKGSVTAIREDRNHIMWVGTYTGLEKITTQRSSEDENYSISFDIRHYRNIPGDKSSLSCDIITQLYEDENENLWISTFGGGLNKYNMIHNQLTHYTTENGLPDNIIEGILPDSKGNLWLSTLKGLSKFNPETGLCRNYNKSDGLPSDQLCGSFKTSDGEMFFGALNGLISIYPDSIKENTHVPPVVITSFKIFNREAELEKSILVTKEIILSHKDNFFSFKFAALDYTNPVKNQYMYMLEGIDEDWVKTTASRREAAYTDISPGEYTFRVKGSNNDGVWNEEGASVKIIITPPWWQTWWFRGCGMILIIGFMGYIRQRKISMMKKELQIQAEFTKQLIESQEKERKRIAGELHDSLGQNLLIIKNKALMGKKNPRKNKELIDDISELSSSTLEEVREISYNLHPYQLESLGLTRAIESITEKAESSTGIKFENDLDLIDNILSPEAEINIYRIIQECVNNIIKHSGASRVKLKIKREIEKLSVTISDNGKGYDVSAVLSGRTKMSLGLMDITERAKLLGGKVTFESTKGKGSGCTIVLTIKKN